MVTITRATMFRKCDLSLCYKAAICAFLAGAFMPQLLALPLVLLVALPLPAMYIIGCAYHQASVEDANTFARQQNILNHQLDTARMKVLLAQARLHMNELQTENAAYEMNIATLHNEIDIRRDTIATLGDQLEDAEFHQMVAERRGDELFDKTREQQERIAYLEEQVEDYDRYNMEASHELMEMAHLKMKNDSLFFTLRKLRTKIEQLENCIKWREGIIEELELELEELRPPNLLDFHATDLRRALFDTLPKMREEEEEPQLQSLEGMEKNAKELELAVWKTKCIPLVSLIKQFLCTESVTSKLGCLMGIWQLYTDTPPSDQLKVILLDNLGHITFFFVWAERKYHEIFDPEWTDAHEDLLQATEPPTVDAQQATEPPVAAIVKTAAEGVIPDVLNLAEANEPPSQLDENGEEIPKPQSIDLELEPEWKKEFEGVFQAIPVENGFLENNRALLSLAAIAIAMIGVLLPPGIIFLNSDKGSLATAIVDLGKTITAKNIIWAEVFKLRDNLMWTLWKICGKHYIPAEDKDAQLVQQKMIKHMKDLQAYERLLNSDFFGAMKSEKLTTIADGIRLTEELFGQLAAVKRSQYNLTTTLAQIKSGYEDLLKKRLDLITNAIGKQKPVVIHITGPAGHGKSVFMKRLIGRLEDSYGITTYYRNAHDEFWSRFAGQQILVWDDIGFKKDGDDYAEFCYHTECAPSSAIGAAIKEKGRPTNPLFIILTSNPAYLGPQGHPLTTTEAFHRRRDVLIDFRNEKAAMHLEQNGTTIPSHLYDESATRLTLLRPMPALADESNVHNKIGTTNENLLWNFIVESEKNNANDFKKCLRLKSYYQGTIPEDQEVNLAKLTNDYLTGKVIIEEPTTVDRAISYEDVVGELLRALPTAEKFVATKEKFADRECLSQEDADEVIRSTAEMALTDSVDAFQLRLKAMKIREDSERVEAQGLAGVNPTRKIESVKKPAILISGPSGTGKTHLSHALIQKMTQGEFVKLEPSQVEKDGFYSGKVVFIDDVTMSKEMYMRAIEVANWMYEGSMIHPPKAMIINCNDAKLKTLVDSSYITELRRRSHCVDLTYRVSFWSPSTWMTYFKDTRYCAVDYKNALECSDSKNNTAAKYISAKYTVYGGAEVNIMPSEIAVMLEEANNQEYADTVVTTITWTLPLPENYDFAVHLSKPLRECSEIPQTTVMASLWSGSLYSVIDVTGRFTKMGAMSMVWDIFKQAPIAPKATIADFVDAFNEAEIKSTFQPPGQAIISTPEGTIALAWLGEDIRMFKVSSDPVELADNKIDIHRYFNPDVPNVYKNLCENMIFNPDNIGKSEELVKEMQHRVFKEKNTIGMILNTILSLLMTSLTVAVPVLFIRDMFKDLDERNELRYYRGVHRRHQKWYNSPDPREVRAGETYSPEKLEEMLREREMSNPDVMEILLRHPQLESAVAHSRSSLPNLRRLMTHSNPIVPSLDEGITVRRTQSPKDVYGGSRTGEKIAIRGPIAESWHQDKDDQDDALELDGDERYELSYEDHARLVREQQERAAEEKERILRDLRETEDYIEKLRRKGAMIWESKPDLKRKADARRPVSTESKPTPIKKSATRTSVESKPDPVKTIKKKVVAESSPQVVKKRVNRVKTESRRDIKSSEGIGAEEAVEIAREYAYAYVYGKPNDFPATTGPDPAIAARITMQYRDSTEKWVIVCFDEGHAPPALEAVDEECEEGTIIRVKRGMAGHSYWHYGIVGPSPTGRGGPHVYHVQSNRGANGGIGAFIAVEPLWTLDDDWEACDRLVWNDQGEAYVPAEDYSFLVDHAYKPFPYNVNSSNCETWALAMRYGDNCLVDAEVQVLPSYFITLLEVAGTFSDNSKKFAEIRDLAEVVQTQACVDGAALHVVRHDVPKAAVFIHSINGVRLSNGMGIRGRYVLMNNHIKGSEFYVERFADSGVLVRAHAQRVWSDEKTDLALLQVTDRSFPEFKDITNKFMDVEEVKKMLAPGVDSIAMLNVPVYDKSALFVHCSNVRIQGCISEEFTGDESVGKYGLQYVTKIIGAESGTAVTAMGDCGSPIVLFHKGISRKILGIHRAGTTTKMYMSIVTRQKLQAAFAACEPQTEGLLVGHVQSVQMGEIDEDSQFPLVAVSCYGKARTRGTKLQKSPIEIEALPCDGEPAILGPRDPRAENYNPAKTTLANFPKDPISPNRKELRVVANEIVEYLLDVLRGKSLEVFSLPEAINGPSRIKYPVAGSIDRKTSPGFPHMYRDKAMTKQCYFTQLIDSEGNELWRVDQTKQPGRNLLDDISTMIGVAKEGKRPDVLFSYFPKDEVLAKRKIDSPKTRGILASNVAYVLAYRRYFLALHLRVQEFFDILPIKIGIDPHQNWDELTRYHLAKGNIGFDADAKNWDASVPVEFLEECAYIANCLYRELDKNWTEEDDKVRTSLHECVESPYILYDGKVIQTPSGQVSGQPGTAFDNSLINWMLVALIYKRIARKTGNRKKATFSHFMENCALSVYGDDMLVTVGRESADWFTLDLYAEEALDFGFTITSADKQTGISSRQMKLTDMTFLKRSFKKIEASWVGPIELDSIAKSLKWVRGSGTYFPAKREDEIIWKTSDDLAVIAENFKSQLVETALHGKELFETVKRQMNEGLRDHGMAPITLQYVAALINGGVVMAEGGTSLKRQSEESSDELAQQEER